MPNNPSCPLNRLIEARRAALGLSRMDVLRRMGYRSISKGPRRLEAIKRGDLYEVLTGPLSATGGLDASQPNLTARV